MSTNSQASNQAHILSASARLRLCPRESMTPLATRAVRGLKRI